MINTIFGRSFAAIAVAWEVNRTPAIKRGKSFIVVGPIDVVLNGG
jgi:hypothetical protein